MKRIKTYKGYGIYRRSIKELQECPLAPIVAAFAPGESPAEYSTPVWETDDLKEMLEWLDSAEEEIREEAHRRLAAVPAPPPSSPEPVYLTDRKTGKMGLRCLDCGKVSVHPATSSDGRCCPYCNGRTVPLGYVAQELSQPPLESRCCENCGNTPCAQSPLAIWWDSCVEDGFTRHWRPKDELRIAAQQAGRLPCYNLHAELEQLRRLQLAYTSHLSGAPGRKLLPWLQRAIDLQHKAVDIARQARNEARPRGCRSCSGGPGCPYAPDPAIARVREG